MRIAHVSDLHFGAHSPAIADALTDDLHAMTPDLVVVSGDFTQVGSVGEFEMAEAFMNALPAPCFAVPGNHDIPAFNLWARFTDPYGRYRRYIAEELEPFAEYDGVTIAGLKTTRRARFGLDWSDGSISRRQLRRLSERLDETDPEAFRIVVGHHPLLHPDEGGVTQDIVSRSAEALAAFARAGVDMVLSGHFHVSYVRSHSAPKQVDMSHPDDPAQRHILVLQTGSAISTRLRGHPNAYNLIDVHEGTATLRRRIWDEDAWREGDQLIAADETESKLARTG